MKLIILFQTLAKIQKLLLLMNLRFKQKLKFGLKDLPVKLERTKLMLKLKLMPLPTELKPRRLKEKLMLLPPRPPLLRLMQLLLLKKLSPTTSKIK